MMTEQEFRDGLEVLSRMRRGAGQARMIGLMGFKRGRKVLERVLKGGRRPEGGGRMSEVGGRMSEDGCRMSDVGGRNTGELQGSGIFVVEGSSSLSCTVTEKEKEKGEGEGRGKEEKAIERGSEKGDPDSYRGARERKAVRLRDDFPFLGEDDCPEILKVLVADMLTTHDRYVKGHAKLFDVAHRKPDVCFKAAEVVVENYIENRLIWNELEHYRKTKTLLGTHPLFAIRAKQEAFATMNDAEKKKYKESLRKKIWKRNDMLKQNPKSEHAERWREERSEFEAESEALAKAKGKS